MLELEKRTDWFRLASVPLSTEGWDRSSAVRRSFGQLGRINLGVLLEAQDRRQEAEKALRDAIRINPQYGEAHYTLGVLLKEQGRSREADTALRAAYRIDPSLRPR